jgi:organic radical activating enzyme
MRAADQWVLLENELGADWTEARLAFSPEGSPAPAAAILAPLGPGRVGEELRFHISRSGGEPERLRNLLERLDRNRIWGTLSVTGPTAAPTDAAIAEPVTAARTEETVSLANAWDAALARLAPGWSDLLCELVLDSSDHLPRAALLGAPLNPTRDPEAVALRFRVSGKQGYGVSPGMARRCFERMDADGITGRISVLNALSDTENAETQGPVWRIAGRSV